MARGSALVAAIGTLLLATSCGESGAGSGSGRADGGGVSGTAQVSLALDRQGNRGDDLDVIHLEVVHVLELQDDAAKPDDGAACRVAGALQRDVDFHVDVDLHGAGRAEVGRLDFDAGRVAEVRLLVRAADVEQHGRHRQGRGRLTCRDDDGTVLIVLRLVPRDRIDLDRDQDQVLVARFDDQDDVDEEACEVQGLARRADSGGDDDCEPDDDRGDDGGDGLGMPRSAGDHGGGNDGGGGGGGASSRSGSRVLLVDTLPLSRAQ